MTQPSPPVSDRRCTCPAWHPDNDHTEAEHTSCSGYHRCGGCDDCVSATVSHGQWGREGGERR